MAVLAIGLGAVDPITITNNRGKLDLFVIVPEGAVVIQVSVVGEHTFKSSAREVRFRQEAFTFRDLPEDTYEIEAVFEYRDGHTSHLVTHANVSR